MSNGIPYVDACREFYTTKHDRRSLSTRTVYYDPRRTDLPSAPQGSLLLCHASDAAALVSEGRRPIAAIEDVSGTPSLSVYQK